MDDLFKVNALKNQIYKLITVLFILLPVSMLFAHGPKGHEGNEFTALQAAKKGIALYDSLVEAGKLVESWETDLKDIEVSLRQKGNHPEVVVKFRRRKGDPQTVYIFFNEKGEYTGSNFTGE
ncbi:MAG: hypothetical protein JSW04_06870 [Desulfobacterales bacterium]|nr:MAG: hypothetical protein JSW04_06870 [Desulfobacterales bacterium]